MEESWAHKSTLSIFQSSVGKSGISGPSSTPISALITVSNFSLIVVMIRGSVDTQILDLAGILDQIEKLNIIPIVEFVDPFRPVPVGRGEIPRKLVSPVEHGAHAAPLLHVGLIPLFF